MKKSMKIAVHQVIMKPQNCFYIDNTNRLGIKTCYIDITNRLGDKDLPSSSLSDK